MMDTELNAALENSTRKLLADIPDDQLLMFVKETDEWLLKNSKEFPKNIAWGGMLARKLVAYSECYRRFYNAK